MTARRYSYGIRIEGIGSDTSKSGGLVFYAGLRMSAAQIAATDYEWVGGPRSGRGLVELPKASDSKVVIPTASLSTSSHRFRLHLDDVAARALMSRQLLPSGYVAEALDLTETSITLSSEFGAADAGTVVHIGDEAVLLGSWTGLSFFGSTRAYWGTRARPLPQYTRVFRTIPYRKGREVVLLRYDHATSTLTERWRGILEDAPGTNREHTALELTAREILAPLADGTVNRGAPDLSQLVPGKGAPFVGQTSRRNRVTGTVAPGPVRVRTKTLAAELDHWSAFQVGQALVFAWMYDTRGIYSFFQDTTLSTDDLAGVPQLGSRIEEENDVDPVYEVLAVVRSLDVVDGLQVADADAKSGTVALDYPFHPLAIAMALLVSSWRTDASGWDVFGPEWGLDAPADWFDVTEIEQLIEDTQEVVVDQLVLGWDGDEVRVWEVVKQLCRTYGFFPAVTNEGRITFKIAREAGPAEVFGSPTVRALPRTLQWEPSEAEGIDVISGRLGELPWRKGRPYSVQMLDRTDADNPIPQHSRRSGILAARSEATIDMPTRSEFSGSLGALESLAAARRLASPRVMVEVPDDDGFGHGDFVRLAPLDTRGNVLRDTAGELVGVDDSARWVGIVVNKRPIYENATADITLQLTNYYLDDFPRLRAPAAEIASGTTTLTLTASVFTDGDDGAEFTAGDVVELWTSHGARRSSESRVIDSIGANSITLVSAFTTAPEAGDILRLAHLDDVDGYPEDGNAALYSGLAYAYAADADRTIGPNDLEAHIYGQGTI